MKRIALAIALTCSCATTRTTRDADKMAQLCACTSVMGKGFV